MTILMWDRTRIDWTERGYQLNIEHNVFSRALREFMFEWEGALRQHYGAEVLVTGTPAQLFQSSVESRAEFGVIEVLSPALLDFNGEHLRTSATTILTGVVTRVEAQLAEENKRAQALLNALRGDTA